MKLCFGFWNSSCSSTAASCSTSLLLRLLTDGTGLSFLSTLLSVLPSSGWTTIKKWQFLPTAQSRLWSSVLQLKLVRPDTFFYWQFRLWCNTYMPGFVNCFPLQVTSKHPIVLHRPPFPRYSVRMQYIATLASYEMCLWWCLSLIEEKLFFLYFGY